MSSSYASVTAPNATAQVSVRRGKRTTLDPVGSKKLGAGSRATPTSMSHSGFVFDTMIYKRKRLNIRVTEIFIRSSSSGRVTFYFPQKTDEGGRDGALAANIKREGKSE